MLTFSPRSIAPQRHMCVALTPFTSTYSLCRLLSTSTYSLCRPQRCMCRLLSSSGPLQRKPGNGKKSSNGKLQRIERILSNRGLGSRKQMASIFRSGRVSVDGAVVRSGAKKYPTDTQISVAGIGEITAVPLLAAFHKPVGVVSTMKDEWGRKSLAQLSLDFPFLRTMHPVGRLDADTSGLLLFSRDGILTQRLLHPSYCVPREYTALVLGEVQQQQLTRVLKDGVQTTDGIFPADLLQVAPSDITVPSDEAQRRTVPSTKEGWGESCAEEMSRTSTVRVRVTEGKYRMVRRVLHNAGHSVLLLHRVQYGQVQLGALEEGQVEAVTGAAAAWARGLL